jgi:RNA polymerase sigma-70 factor (ECF subfamily)
MLAGFRDMELETLIEAARRGELAAYASLVERTQRMVFAVCYRVLRDHAESHDAVQETYLRAFRRLGDLREPAALPGWLRRIALTTARSIAGRKRIAFLHFPELPDVPVLDEAETQWSESQRQALARALLDLAADDRRICDRFYHGGWDIARLAADANTTEPAMRKRLQRIRDRLREDAEMNEKHQVGHASLATNMPAKVVELLARPKLTDLPENPIGAITELLNARYAEYRMVDVPEIIDVEDARAAIGSSPHHLEDEFIHRVDGGRFLRYDMTVPLLIAAKNIGSPVRIGAVGQVYRRQTPTPMRDESFHQFEVLAMDSLDTMNPWAFMGQTLQVAAELLPGRNTKIEPVNYPSCNRAWEISVEVDGRWIVVLSWGVYSEKVVCFLGGDPAICSAFGLGFGLERMAAIHFGYDDIRKLSAANVKRSCD